MQIRKQLLAISLVTLALPWVGCQSVREMDKAMRKGQGQALLATAHAAVARIQSEDSLLSEFKSIDPALSLYAHPLNSDVVLDGYNDDWISQNLSTLPLSSNPQIEAVLASDRENLYAFLQIELPEIRYFNPSAKQLFGTTHLQIVTGKDRFALFANGPGQASVVALDSAKDLSKAPREYRIKALWMENESGFQVELSMPRSWAASGLAFNLHRHDELEQKHDAMHQVIFTSNALEQELDVYSSNQLKLKALDANSHLLAEAGRAGFKQANNEPHGLLTWIYSLALRNRDFSPLPSIEADGSFSTAPFVDTEDSINWYSVGSRPVTQASAAIRSAKGEIRGFVLAEQSTQVLADSNDIFSKILVYSFLAATLAALSLVFYASWLSIRIRKLSSAASKAISESGKIDEHFPVFRSRDELGELSRNYAQLLTRLREYTNYLRTLSSKLSHELRTPLAIVRTSLDNLEHEPLEKQAKVYAERAKEGASRLSSILNAMSAASRVEQAIDASEMEVIPCDELLMNLKAAYEDVYPHVQFELKVRKDSKGLKVNGSGELLVQALDKLIDNAADFCPEEGLIEIGLYRHQDDIIITIHNEGPPLPKHMHGQLFDSMVSMRDQASAADSHHLGLGLYIVRLITEFHKGEVQGYNVPDNSGVIFEIRLPAA